MGRSGRSTVRARAGRNAASLVLAVAMATANVLGYGSVLLVSGALGPASFGAVAALTGLGVVVSVPGGTLQVLVAGRRSHGRPVHGSVGIGLRVGLLVAAAVAVLSPVISASFSLGSVWPALWLAVAVVPTTVGSVQQGLLLGDQRLRSLSGLVVLSGASRLAASIWLALSDADVTTVMAGWAVAATVPVLVGLLVVRTVPVDDAAPWRWTRALIGSSAAFGALIVMTNTDVVLARHYLAAYDSGLYGVASMFARVIFWATQFIAMVVIPRLAGTAGRRVVVQAYVAVLVVASPALLVLAAVPDLTLRLMGLGDYRAAAHELVVFGVLGVLWACIQVSTFVGITRERRQVTIALWAGVVVQIVLTAAVWHDTTAQVLGASLAGAVVALAVVWARPLRRSATASG